jgi:hypothetical protein
MKRSSIRQWLLTILGLLAVSGMLACYSTHSDRYRSDYGSLQVTNGSTAYAMTEFYVTPQSASGWGVNQLDGQRVSPGATTFIDWISPGIYDVKAVWSDGVSSEQQSLTLSAGYTTEVTMLDTGSLRVTNADTFTMTNLYISSSPDTWGPDLLRADVAPGGSVTIARLDPGTYDVKAVWSDGATYEELSLTVWADYTTTLSMLPRSSTQGAMRITNGATAAMSELYVTLASAGTWGLDQLDGQGLASGSSLLLTQIDPGIYDIRAYWTPSHHQERSNVALDAGQTLNLTMDNTGTLVIAPARKAAAPAPSSALRADGQRFGFHSSVGDSGPAKTPPVVHFESKEADVAVPFRP